MVNFPSTQPTRMQYLEPKPQFNNADLTKALDKYQSQFKSFFENNKKESIPEPTQIKEPEIKEPTQINEPTQIKEPTRWEKLSKFMESKVAKYSINNEPETNEQRQQRQAELRLKRQIEADENLKRELYEKQRQIEADERLKIKEYEKNQKKNKPKLIKY